MVCKVINLGQVDYLSGYNFQKHCLKARQENKISDTLILLEHLPVITIGRNGKKENILSSEEHLHKEGIEIFQIDRGGDVTLHCPGQLVGYPIIDLTQNGRDVHRYIRNLEEVIIRLLKDYGLTAKRKEGYTGVWINERKISSIGIGVKHWITYHGFALNLNPDMRYFSLINPCGLSSEKMISLSEVLNQELNQYHLRAQLIRHFGEVFNLRMEIGFPPWIKRKVTFNHNYEKITSLLHKAKLHTVCQSAACPNIHECFSESRVTFIILGNICTRGCKFCGVKKGTPLPVNPEEPYQIAQAVQDLGLKHVVITSVTRDDLPDGGASHFRETIKEIRKLNSKVTIEVLIPDFRSKKNAVKSIVEIKPDIIAHNIETVPRLYLEVRPQADYSLSLNLLKLVKKLEPNILTKSGLMLGLGETKKEVLEVMQALREVECDILTIGQYLPPTSDAFPVKEFILPGEFKKYKEIGKAIGFRIVMAGPFVRSSYHQLE
jgi:lipoic acid synthetase